MLHDVTVLKWHRHTMFLSLGTYLRCLMPPSASNASSWATKNSIQTWSRNILEKIFKNNRLPSPLHSFASKSHIWWFCRMSLDEGMLLQEQTCLHSLHLFKLGQVVISAPFSCQCPRLESLVVLSDRPYVLPQSTVFESILTCSSGSNHGFGGRLEQKSCH